MNDLTPSALAPPDAAALAALDTEQLRAELAQSLRLTAAALVRLAWILRTLEERGEDLGELHAGLPWYLRLIAYGQLLPEAVVRFAGNPSLLRRIAGLPLPDQRRLADGEPVKLLVRAEAGTDYRPADPLKMTAAQLGQVFARDHLRGRDEQILLLEDRRTRPAKVQGPKVGHLRIAREAGGVIVGRVFVPVADLVEALAALAGGADDKDDDENRNKILAIPLTPAEHASLKSRAGADAMAKVARNALRAAGLI